MTHALPPPLVDDALLGWAADIGRLVGRRWLFRHGSQEVADLVQVACLTVVRAARRFDPRLVPAGGDPGGQLRGWCRRDIVSECEREAVRLLNGGCFHTKRRRPGARLVIATPFSVLAAARENGRYDLPDDYRDDAIAEPDPPPDPGPPIFDLTAESYPAPGQRVATYSHAFPAAAGPKASLRRRRRTWSPAHAC